MTLLATHEYFVRVYSEDVDQMGIVYHANYLCFFERARSEMLRARELSLSQLASYDCHFAISEVQIHFRAPARLDDLLKVETTVGKRHSCSIVFEQGIQNQDNTLICEAQIKIVCVNGAMKVQRIPTAYFN